MKDKEIFEQVYEKPNKAIWTGQEPHIELIQLVKSGKIKKGKVLEIGCGEGRDAIYLASQGFDVTAIDLSENAIKHAKENAKKEDVDIRFMTMDLMNLYQLNEKFDFILEYAIMHSIMFEKRKKHIENVNNLLNENGTYFSMCFNIKDYKFGGVGRIREVPEKAKMPAGTKLYFTSLEELKELFEPYFKIIESKVFEKPGAGGRPNTFNYFFMEKK